MTNITDNQSVRRTRGVAALLRRVWLSLVLFLFAVASLALGTYYAAHPAWRDRADLREYNAGVIGYYALPILGDPLNTGDSPQAHFATARAVTQDQRLRALAAYNLGTILGMDAARALLSADSLHTAGIRAAGGDNGSQPANAQAEIGQALAQLADAVRSDPSNENAKFNLELLEKMLPDAAAQSPGQNPGHGYSAGQPNKGY